MCKKKTYLIFLISFLSGHLVAQNETLGSIGKQNPFIFYKGSLKIKVSKENSNHWLYLGGSLH